MKSRRKKRFKLWNLPCRVEWLVFLSLPDMVTILLLIYWTPDMFCVSHLRLYEFAGASNERTNSVTGRDGLLVQNRQLRGEDALLDLFLPAQTWIIPSLVIDVPLLFYIYRLQLPYKNGSIQMLQCKKNGLDSTNYYSELMNSALAV